MRNSHKLNVWLALFTLTLVVMFGVNIVNTTTNASGLPSNLVQTQLPTPTRIPLIPFQQPTPQPVCPPSCDHLVNVQDLVVKIAVPFTDESQLSTDQISEQRRQLSNAVESLDNTLKASDPMKSRAVVAFYPRSPYVIVSNFRQKALSTLINNPQLVKQIYGFYAFGEYFDLGLSHLNLTQESMMGSANFPLTEKRPKCLNSYGGNSCIEQLITAINYKYARTYIIIQVKYNLSEYIDTRPVDKFTEWTARAFYTQLKAKFIHKYKNYILNQDEIDIAPGFLLPDINLRLTSEGFEKLLADPEAETVAVGWDELDQKYRPNQPRGNIADGLYTNGNTATPKFRPPQTNLDHINYPYGNIPNTEGMQIVLIDDGVIQNHPGAQGRILPGYCLGYGDPSCFNGYANTQTPAPLVNTSFYANPCYPDLTFPPPRNPDNCGHGSLQAGIISANDSEFGGIDPKVIVYPVRQVGALHADAIFHAIQYADNNPNVVAISLSMSWGNTDKHSQVGYCLNNPTDESLNNRIGRLKAKGILTFVATGNNNTVGKVHVPACYPNAISVGAVDPNIPNPEKIWVENSTKGSNTYPYLSLYAPGYGWGYGVDPQYLWVEYSTTTSQAAPHAAAVWSLYRKRFSSQPMNKIIERFLSDDPKIQWGVNIMDTRPTSTSALYDYICVNCYTNTPVSHRKIVPRVDLGKLNQPFVVAVNVTYDYVPSAGASVTPPLSCDYLAAGQDCTLREAVAAALPQDVISFL